MSRVLTRDSILSGEIRRRAKIVDSRLTLLSDAERERSLRATLAAAPADEVWVFGYGSLVWNPAFHFTERSLATVHGYHRRFCLWSTIGRGSPDAPGLMLGLDHGGCCRGVAYRVDEAAAGTELDILWRREMLAEAYRAVWTPVRLQSGRRVHAITFVINRSNARYIPRLDEAEAARHISGAAGNLGPCHEYLFETIAHLAELGIPDRPLERLAALVRRTLQVQPGARPCPTSAD